MAPETTVVAAVVAPTAKPVVSFENGEAQFTKSDEPMPAAAGPKLAEGSSSFPEQHVLLQAVPAAEIEAELREKAVAAPAANNEVQPGAAPTSGVQDAWQVELVDQAAGRLAESLLHRTPKEIADDLLKRLLQEKEARQRLNLNHWSDYAPAYLNKMVRSLSNQEAWRRRAIDAFFRSDYEKACAIAQAGLDTREEAEDAVSEAFVRVQRGRPLKLFYRVLKDVVIMRRRKKKKESGLFISMEEIPSSARGQHMDPDAELSASSLPIGEYPDTLTVLMDRRNTRARPLMVGQAKKRPKMRRVRRSMWIGELEKSRPKLAAQAVM
jgi:hypothetical protein